MALVSNFVVLADGRCVIRVATPQAHVTAHERIYKRVARVHRHVRPKRAADAASDPTLCHHHTVDAVTHSAAALKHQIPHHVTPDQLSRCSITSQRRTRDSTVRGLCRLDGERDLRRLRGVL